MEERWFVVKVGTENGYRIGIDMQEVGEERGGELAGPMPKKEAIIKSEVFSESLGIPQYDTYKDTDITNL